jgi:GntR family transcriptional repressor for pyruvate dehydrogenase complex
MGAAIESQRRRTAVHRVADQLCNEACSSRTGPCSGRRRVFSRGLGVSRPTLRQTARLLEQEQILSVRGGVKGGYCVRTPDVGAIGHMAATPLRMRKATLLETYDALELLLDDVFRSAAEISDAAARDAFDRAAVEFSCLDANRSESVPPERALLDEETLFLEAVVVLAGNPAIELMIRILYEFCLGETGERASRDRPERIQAWRHARNQIVEAIQRGEVEQVVSLEKRRRETLSEWFDEGFADGG